MMNRGPIYPEDCYSLPPSASSTGTEYLNGWKWVKYSINWDIVGGSGDGSEKEEEMIGTYLTDWEVTATSFDIQGEQRVRQ